MDKNLVEKLFHSSDIRSDASLFTPEVIEKITHAEAYYLKHDLKTTTLVLAHDARLTGSEILERKAELFLSFGFTVSVITSPVSTPLFYYTVLNTENSAGIMITASHNPKNFNGEKLVAPNLVPMAKEKGKGALDIIEKYFIEGKEMEKKSDGKLLFPDMKNKYIEDAKSFLSLPSSFCPNFSFGVDFLSGTASHEICLALENYKGVRFSSFIPNGSFPKGAPNPIYAKPEIKENEEFLLLFDGDGDRMDVIANDGNEIPPSVILSFILPYISPKKGKVCLDPKASPIIRDYLEKEGYTTLLVPTGHSKIKSIMNKDKDIVAACEESGHYYLNVIKDEKLVSYENTMITTLAFLCAYSNEKEKLNSLIALNSSCYRVREWTHLFHSDNSRKETMNQIRSLLKNKGFELNNTLPSGEPLGSDIFTKNDKDNWIQIIQRSSETELYLCRYEILASNKDEAEKAKEIIEESLRGKE